jgi:phosphoglucosamine mutase
VDELGHPVNGDQVMAVIAQSWKEDGRLSRPGIVATVMSNLGLERYLGGRGLALARTKVGDRYVVEHMRASGCNIGGEQSGHLVLSDFGTTGDGLVAALQVLAAVAQRGRPVSEVTSLFAPLPQVLKGVRYRGASPLGDEDVSRAVEAVRQKLGDAGRVLVRASGTEPLIRVMVEGEDAAAIEALADEIVAAVAKRAA